MDYRYLGRTGLKVSPICLGTAFRGQADEGVCIRTLDRAIDLGCNFVDTALYGEGRSETIIGKVLKNKRGDVVLTTKVYAALGSSPNHSGLSRVNLLRAVDASLQRLHTDYIDLYLLHSFDAHTPLEETIRALDDIVRQGKARYIGCSNFPPWKVMESLWTSDRRNLERFVCLQYSYSLLNRTDVEPELLPMCRQYGLGMMAYSPLAIGLLTGRFRRGRLPAPDSPWGDDPRPGLSRTKYRFEAAMTEKADRIVQTLIDLSGKYGKTPAQVALAWILEHEEVTAPIVGADLPEQVEEAVGAAGWRLEAQDRKLLDDVSAPDARPSFG
jgi:1-deoxyxylulose-5-phosphate synthase